MIFKCKHERKSKSNGSYFESQVQRLSEKLPEQVYGDIALPKKFLYKIYGESYDERLIKKHRYDIAQKYVMVLIGLGILILAYLLNSVMYEEILKNEGGVFFIERPKGNTPLRVELIAQGRNGDEEFREMVRVSVKGKEGKNENIKSENDEKADPEAIRKGEMRRCAYEISNTNEGERVILPREMADLKGITWKEKREGAPVWIIAVGAVALAGVYWGRNDKFKKKLKECNESIEEDLPNFLNKMVLLMNSGMVFSSAFQRAVESEIGRGGIEKVGYFYGELQKIQVKVRETKTSLTAELKKFAERSENREWMRVVNVVSNNVEKGTEPIQVLEAESGLLWFKRKKRAEEKAKVAETKMSLPLAIQLFVLITITLAPAMLEMR